MKISVIRAKEGRLDTSNILRKKMHKVTSGTLAAKTVVEEFVDANRDKEHKRRRPGNERLKKDRAYLSTLSRFGNNYFLSF